MLKFSAIEIYNEAVRDLLSLENVPLRLLDDPEVNNLLSSFIFIYSLFFYIRGKKTKNNYRDSYGIALMLQKGTVVEKLTEETLRDRNHLHELLSFCEGENITLPLLTAQLVFSTSLIMILFYLSVLA